MSDVQPLSAALCDAGVENWLEVVAWPFLSRDHDARAWTWPHSALLPERGGDVRRHVDVAMHVVRRVFRQGDYELLRRWEHCSRLVVAAEHRAADEADARGISNGSEHA